MAVGVAQGELVEHPLDDLDELRERDSAGNLLTSAQDRRGVLGEHPRHHVVEVQLPILIHGASPR